ncbi:MAG TPA: hypothetical protein PKG60_05160 [Spirochaetota bacterium]|nr:hypothetical protein [Spirochaetota bacterium]HPS88020.1 hypothetical protein [Spirochaetota bacterium]
MDKKRETVRLSIGDIPEILRKPVLMYNNEEVGSIIENLSPLGVGLVVDKNAAIEAGDFFYLKYYTLESDIKCLCVYSEDNGNSRSIGAFFTESKDHKLILGYLHFQNEN